MVSCSVGEGLGIPRGMAGAEALGRCFFYRGGWLLGNVRGSMMGMMPLDLLMGEFMFGKSVKRALEIFCCKGWGRV